MLRQATMIFHEDIAPHIPSSDGIYEASYNRLCRELGVGTLGEGHTYDEQCIRFIAEPYDLWIDRHGAPDTFFKFRLSLIELLFQETENKLKSSDKNNDLQTRLATLQKRVLPKTRAPSEAALEAFVNGIDELNARFSEAGLPLEYHNGLIQIIDDPLTGEQIEHPFWVLVSDVKWRNIDSDIKEAIDRRDAGKGDAAFFALRALESTISIISDDLSATRGTERGASAFVDNLVSSRGKRYIHPWEAEAMKFLFRELRNPQGHGAGSKEPLNLTPEQSTFVIESCMAWVKSLVRRKR